MGDAARVDDRSLGKISFRQTIRDQLEACGDSGEPFIVSSTEY